MFRSLKQKRLISGAIPTLFGHLSDQKSEQIDVKYKFGILNDIKSSFPNEQVEEYYVDNVLDAIVNDCKPSSSKPGSLYNL